MRMLPKKRAPKPPRLSEQDYERVREFLDIACEELGFDHLEPISRKYQARAAERSKLRSLAKTNGHLQECMQEP